MEGDENVLKRSKGGRQIKFDIVIPTPKGALYGMYIKRASEGTRVTEKLLPVNWH